MAGVSPDRVARAPREGEWSVLETLTHLRDVVVHVQGSGSAASSTSAHRSSRISTRRATVAPAWPAARRLLRSLDDADWSREGHHPTLGAMSIERLARQLGEHTEEHAAQIASAARAG
jgi:hypothetical protein